MRALLLALLLAPVLGGAKVLNIEFKFTPFVGDWHHFSAITALTDDDKQKLGALVKERADAFKPDFAALYNRRSSSVRSRS